MASRGVLDVSWTPPTTNVDGSSVPDGVSYRVYYSTVMPPCPGGKFLTVPPSWGKSRQTVSTKLTNLKAGDLYYIAVTAVSNGRESDCSATESARARNAQ